VLIVLNYGLKEASQAWYTKTNNFLRQHVLMRNEIDHNLYCKNSNPRVMIFMLYIDDLLLIENDVTMLKKVKVQLEEQFKMFKLAG
jgi:hypothetical protein